MQNGTLTTTTKNKNATRKKTKVLFLVNHEIVIYNFRKEIVEEFLSKGFEVIISSPPGEKIDELIKMGCKHESLEINRHGKSVFEDVKLLRYYDKLMKITQPDIVLTFTIKPNIYGGIAATRNKIPFVANITGLGSAVEKKTLLQKIIIMMYKYAFREVQTVFFQNKENKQFFVDNKIAVNQHKLLPGSGVNLKQFQPLKYPDTSNEINFVFISRIMKEKGIDHYLEAAEYIKNRMPNINFHICGFCEEEYEDILTEMEKKNIIKYHGMVSDVRNILAITHCTIHPTYYPEGLSNVLLESSASARPIITTNRSGCREVVNVGENGYLIEQRDTDDLISKIKEFIKLDFSEKQQMGIKGREKVEKEFDRQIVVSAYLSEIKIANEVK